VAVAAAVTEFLTEALLDNRTGLANCLPGNSPVTTSRAEGRTGWSTALMKSSGSYTSCASITVQTYTEPAKENGQLTRLQDIPEVHSTQTVLVFEEVTPTQPHAAE
jgi:hypothetical protein